MRYYGLTEKPFSLTSVQAGGITPETVRHAAWSLDTAPLAGPRFKWLRRRTSFAAGAAVVLLAAASAVGLTAFVYQRFVVNTAQARGMGVIATVPSTTVAARPERKLPAGTALTVLVQSYPEGERSAPTVRALTAWLEGSGHRVFYEHVDLGSHGRWWRVLAGTYTEQEYETASWDAARLKAAAPVLQARVVTIASPGRTK